MKIRYHFRISPYTESGLEEQTAQLLKLHTELLSRKQYPKLWEQTDRLNSTPRAEEAVLKRRSIGRRIYGGLLLLLGIILLLPALADPRHEIVMLIAAVIGCAAGVHLLLPQKKKDPLDRFRKSARSLISRFSTIGRDAAAHEAQFSEEFLTLDGNDVPYAAIESILLSEALLLLCWSGHMLLLKKKDLLEDEDFSAFLAFLEKKTGQTASITAPDT